MGHRRDIQIYRGVAVLAVILFHAGKSRFPNGYLGVDVFFVISGFLVIPLVLRIFHTSGGNITEGALFTDKVEFRLFLQRRFLRLFPSLNKGLHISILLSLIFIPLSLHENIAKQALASLILSGNFGAEMLSGDYFRPEPNPLIHLWSLAVEEQFYILAPVGVAVSIWIAKPFILKRKYFFVITILIVFIMVEFLDQIFLKIVGDSHLDTFSYYSTSNHAWQFLFGGLLSSKGLRPRIQCLTTQLFSSSALIFLVALLFFPIPLRSSYSQVAITILTVLVLAFNSHCVYPKVVENSFIWLGNRSYSIYIIHMPVIWIAKHSSILDTNSTVFSAVKAFFAIGMSLALGSWMYSTIEKPYRMSGGDSVSYPKMIKKNVRSLGFTILAIFIFLANSNLSFWKVSSDSITTENSYRNINPNCESDASAQPSCVVITKNALGLVLLIGDSHAHHLAPGLQLATKKKKWKLAVWAQSACPFQLKISTFVTSKCVSNNKAILNWISRNNPNRIILSQYVKKNSDVDLLIAGVLELRTTKSEITVIENSPVFPDQRKFQVEQSILELALIGRYQPPKSYPLDKLVKEDEPNNREFSNRAIRLGAQLISLDPLFCDSEFCTRWSESGWLYKDANHFSLEGSKRTAELLGNQLLLSDS